MAAHSELHHIGGINHTLAELSKRFWIVAAREAIRQCERECAHCKKVNAKLCEQVMAPLPPYRVQPTVRAFEKISVDFAGPFRTIHGRGKPRHKRYMCMFSCLTTRAVHLEVAASLETDAFLNAFHRMTNRHGCPKEVLSDNGTNVVGANKELRRLAEAMDRSSIHKKTATLGVVWRFNPPAAPHFGGVHESSQEQRVRRTPTCRLQK